MTARVHDQRVHSRCGRVIDCQAVDVLIRNRYHRITCRCDLVIKSAPPAQGTGWVHGDNRRFEIRTAGRTNRFHVHADVQVTGSPIHNNAGAAIYRAAGFQAVSCIAGRIRYRVVWIAWAIVQHIEWPTTLLPSTVTIRFRKVVVVLRPGAQVATSPCFEYDATVGQRVSSSRIGGCRKTFPLATGDFPMRSPILHYLPLSTRIQTIDRRPIVCMRLPEDVVDFTVAIYIPGMIVLRITFRPHPANPAERGGHSIDKVVIQLGNEISAVIGFRIQCVSADVQVAGRLPGRIGGLDKTNVFHRTLGKMKYMQNLRKVRREVEQVSILRCTQTIVDSGSR